MDPSGDEGRGALRAATFPCGACGTSLSPNSKFCNECGTPITQAGRSAQYKQVTVLFADVVRSMDIAAALDMERLREVITEVVEGSATVLRRYGGTVEYTGDGVMAIFGAPAALEDHAFRACLAALAIQNEAKKLAVEVARRDGVALRLRVGLNSGRVIAGEIGSGALGYRVIGEHVGMGQRMESVAPPGEVMLSESTARLVDQLVTLSEPEWVRVKGVNGPVHAYRLVAIASREGLMGRAATRLVGRRQEMAALDASLDSVAGGRGGVVTVEGAPGIGKSRMAREASAAAVSRGIEVFWTFCESHASDIPFQVVSRMLRTRTGVTDLANDAARMRVREQFPDADPQDLLLFDDLLGIADPAVPAPMIDPEARRRRLTSLMNAASLTRTDSALFIIEDAHWIDAVSESMLADFFAAAPNRASMLLVTFRPEYKGLFTRIDGTRSIVLGPLSDSDSATLLGELLGSDSSVRELAATITERAAGNPFFTEEIVRELTQQGVLVGQRGNFVCLTDVADVSVPATVQAAIGARIDRLTGPARQTINAASVIGASFDAELLRALDIDTALDEALDAELIDQIRLVPSAEYVFHHPLIRAVTYESQLKSDRAEWHRRLAAVIEARAPDAVEDNAALIAEHLEAAGELRAAYGWHMRAAAWSTNRDLDSARLSWDRARRIADTLPTDDPDHLSMRIAPRTMLCATEFENREIQGSRARFEELRELCSAAGDKVSHAIGITGLTTELYYTGRSREASRLATEQTALLESIGDRTLTVGLAFIAFVVWFDAGDLREVLKWSQTVIDLAAGDPAIGGNFGFGSPLAIALTYRGTARWWLGIPGWHQDLHEAIAMGRDSDPATFAPVVCWTYGHSMEYGVLRADDVALRLAEEAVQAAESSHDVAVSLAEYTLGVTLLLRDGTAERRRGLELMLHFREYVRERAPFLVPVAEIWAARERVRGGDRGTALPLMRAAADEMRQAGRLFHGVWGTTVLAETLLEGDSEHELTEAQNAIDWIESLEETAHSAIYDITLLRLRALSARAHGDEASYRGLAELYREMAESLGFDGHMAWAAAMP